MSDLEIPRTHGDDASGASSASVAADKYDQMLALADLFDSSGNEMRTRARLGSEILSDDDVADSGELSRATWGQAEEDIRAATTGKHGLLTRSVELDADALVVRATVLTYRWIDELQQPPTRRSAPSPAAPSATSPPRSRSAARSSAPG